MSAVRIKVTDNSQVFIRAKDEATQEILDVIGETAEDYAKELVPQPGKSKGYATGALHDSIGHEIDRVAVRIYANTPYASFVEMGTRYMHAQPFLRPAVLDHTEEYHAMAEAIYRDTGNPDKRFRRVRVKVKDEEK